MEFQINIKIFNNQFIFIRHILVFQLKFEIFEIFVYYMISLSNESSNKLS